MNWQEWSKLTLCSLSLESIVEDHANIEKTVLYKLDLSEILIDKEGESLIFTNTSEKKFWKQVMGTKYCTKWLGLSMYFVRKALK